MSPGTSFDPGFPPGAAPQGDAKKRLTCVLHPDLHITNMQVLRDLHIRESMQYAGQAFLTPPCGVAPGGNPGSKEVPGDALGNAELTCFCLIALGHVLWILFIIEKTAY